MRFPAVAIAALAWAQGLAAEQQNEPAAAAVARGEAIYRHGVLPTGARLLGAREGGAPLVGSDAACISCHRRSGLGTTEGRITIPPIAGPYLFAPRTKSFQELGIPFVDTARLNRESYTDATLAEAIRTGLDANGHRLSYLMPRYRLDDAAMADLIAYLKSRTLSRVPGVTPTELHFATIVTPDADPMKRDGMLNVLRQFFDDKNAAVARTKAPALVSSHRVMFRVARRWKLHVWELTGPPADWQAQLERRLAAEPVFAVASGLGGHNWDPVHRFCEAQGLPCLFPNVEAPPGRDDDFYSLYFSRSVLLEAALIAHQLAEAPATIHRIVQIYRSADVGEQAAAALRAAAPLATVPVETRVLSSQPAARELEVALQGVGVGDSLVVWLRAEDLSSLPSLPAGLSSVWISGEMAGLEQAPLPGPWRAVARMAYPVDLPLKRVVRVDYALGWFRIRGIPVVAPQVQVDTYLACGLVSETLNHMVDAFVRDYLIERIEMALDHRVMTGYYPRLSLAPGQRFASKGGYIVRFTDTQGARIAPLGDWTTP
jgi:hypothetical protein